MISVCLAFPLLLACAQSDGPQEPLTLDGAMAYARDHAPSVSTARAQALLARARVRLANAPRFPSLQGSVSTGGRAGANQSRVPHLDVHNPVTWQVGWMAEADATAQLTARWTLWDFGRTSAAVSNAEHGANAARWDAETVASQAALEAAVAFLDVDANTELMQSRERIMKGRERALEVATERVNLGAAAPIEVTRAKVALETARLDLVTSQTALQQGLMQLAEALGLPSTRVFTIARVEKQDGDVDPVHAADLAENNRPELRAASQRIAAAKANEEAARAAARPSLGASAGAGVGLAAQAPPRLNTQQNLDVGLTLTIPLFDPSILANQDVAHAQTLAVRSAQQEQVLAVRAQAAQAAMAVRSQQQAVRQAEQLSIQADANLTLAEGRYQEGAGALLELIDAQTQHAQAQLSLVQARYRLHAEQLRLAAATGALGPEPGR